MTGTPAGPESARSNAEHRSRLTAAVGAAWAATMGVMPHLLHHAGPLAGAAFVAGTTGTLVFGLAAFVFTIPLLRRVRRHRGSWRSPALLLALFVGTWLVSTYVAGPWVRDRLADEPIATLQDSVPAGDDAHDEHHKA